MFCTLCALRNPCVAYDHKGFCPVLSSGGGGGENECQRIPAPFVEFHCCGRSSVEMPVDLWIEPWVEEGVLISGI